jgi:hypothetical protein
MGKRASYASRVEVVFIECYNPASLLDRHKAAHQRERIVGFVKFNFSGARPFLTAPILPGLLIDIARTSKRRRAAATQGPRLPGAMPRHRWSESADKALSKVRAGPATISHAGCCALQRVLVMAGRRQNTPRF